MAPSHFRVVLAKPEDIDTVLGILDEAASWLQEHSIPSVWKPGGFSRQTFLEQISRGEVHIGMFGETPVGTLTLEWADPVFWGEMQPDAGYVHKLAVRPAHAGQKFGLEMLKWAEDAARKAGKKFLRLNCLAKDRKIREYYEHAGFLYKGDVVGPKGMAANFEKAV
ncbi:MAG TPA: GNAT family N-acetyltransferase [Candidatus Bathyarchaeia archaeon]